MDDFLLFFLWWKRGGGGVISCDGGCHIWFKIHHWFKIHSVRYDRGAGVCI